MPELKNNGCIVFSQSGSALATIVPLTVIIAIGIAGYLGMARNSVTQETKETNDDKAFMAAESGLLLGSQMVLSKFQPAVFTSQSDIFGPALRGDHALNGMDVTVNIAVSGSTVTVTSIAQNSLLVSYKKEISRTMNMTIGSISSGAYGVYLDNAYQLGGNTKGIRKMDWDGPAHFNTALKLGNPGKGNECHFNSPVSLYNINPETNLSVYIAGNGTGHFGNDYRNGVEGGSGNWDEEFAASYDPLSSRIVTDFDTADRVDISLNAGDSSLVFGVTAGTPFYRYKKTNGTDTTVSFDTVGNLKLHIVNKGLAVSGSVKGKVSVYTDSGKNIAIPGNLTYADFSDTSFNSTNKATNSGYGLKSENVIGLYSGADYTVPEGTHYVTGQLYAVNKDAASLNFETDKKNKTKLYLFGTLAVNGFWDSKQGNDQATFQQLWDRRSLFAPGLSLKKLDKFGNPITTSTCTYSGWNEANVPY
jgi:hypothetical protein